MTTAIIGIMKRQPLFLLIVLLFFLLVSACFTNNENLLHATDQPVSTASPTFMLTKTELTSVFASTSTPASTQKPGITSETDTTRFREIDNMPLIEIPAGQVWIGCDESNNAGFSCMADELPLHQVYLDTFFIDKFEVTNAQYALCVLDGACDEPYYQHSATRRDYYPDPAYANFPKVAVSWF